MKIVTWLGFGIGVSVLLLASGVRGECPSVPSRGDSFHRAYSDTENAAHNPWNRYDSKSDSSSFLSLQEGVALTGWVDSEERSATRSCLFETDPEKSSKYMIGLILSW
ncbi:MAG: hypothetical protein HQM00_08055 [Magnetococcales bacterium]|jgi:hypothetical protein|nr:hypothetical protein [Magnetococcales bacterium]